MDLIENGVKTLTEVLKMPFHYMYFPYIKTKTMTFLKKSRGFNCDAF